MTATMKSRSHMSDAGGVASARVADQPAQGPQHKALNAFIGKWLTVGQTVASEGAPSATILASDVYEWAPGGFFVVHSAYGRIGDAGVGGIEIIGYDAANKNYGSRFFDSQGNCSTSELTARGSTWIWTGEKTRCTSVTSDDGKSMSAHHERTDDGVKWMPSMDVILTKVE
jgi:Protein of unknown function (DUF1579)